MCCWRDETRDDRWAQPLTLTTNVRKEALRTRLVLLDDALAEKLAEVGLLALGGAHAVDAGRVDARRLAPAATSAAATSTLRWLRSGWRFSSALVRRAAKAATNPERRHASHKYQVPRSLAFRTSMGFLEVGI